MFTTKLPWIILLLVWMVGSTWWHVCKIKQLCADDAPSISAGAGVSTASLADGDRFSVQLPGTFNFAKAGAVPNLAGFDASLDSMATYLQNNPDRQLTLTGYYTAAEAYSGPFPNLGIARAEAIKELLIQRGVPAASLLTVGVEQANLTFNAKGDSVNAGVLGSFGAKVAAVQVDSTASASMAAPTTTSVAATSAPVTEEALAKAEKYESVFKPIDLYFPSGSSNYIRTDETKKFFKEAIRYLRTHKDKNLVLTGYTDSQGPDDTNLQLSKKRANSVKERLLSQGVGSSQIEASGKGEADPKASNDTESGRKANRRVTVVVQ
jgi:OmpA-OmpF porin, OOP family